VDRLTRGLQKTLTSQTGTDQTAAQPSDEACPNCGQAALGAYCSQCGEKRRDRSDFKLSTIASETVGEITNLEHSKLWQTLRLLLLKPGQLTRDHWVGRRKRYLGPVKLYLIVFAVSLVLYSIHQPTAVYDVRTFVAADRAGDASRLLDNIAEKRGIRREQVTQELNSRWQSYISMSQVVYPLFVGLALKLLFLRRGLYFAEHLIFALHVLAFMFFSFALAALVSALRSSDPTRTIFSRLSADHFRLSDLVDHLPGPRAAPGLWRIVDRRHSQERRCFPDLHGDVDIFYISYPLARDCSDQARRMVWVTSRCPWDQTAMVG
jgi:Protein of unknown function (DUF3667)